MATRWGKVRNSLKGLIDKDKITQADVPILDKSINSIMVDLISFGCGACKYMEGPNYLCNKDIEECREGYAEWLNQEIEEE